MKKLYLFALLLLCAGAVFGQKRIKVTCVGNSITYGACLADREREAYPFQLQRLLGEGYEVGNFGMSGTTLLSHGHRPYKDQQVCKDALDFAGDIVVIHLGINDTDPRDWPNYRDEFITDYRNLIQMFRKVNPKARFLVARMTPITSIHPRFESGTRDWHDEIQHAIELVAKAEGAQLIDFHEPLHSRPDLLEDAVHPNAQGAAIMAKTVYRGITGDFGGLQMPQVYSDHMVLQHAIPLAIRGTADSGEKVKVSIDGQKAKAITGTDGRWEVELNPLKAGGPYTLTIATDKKELIYKDVLAGEVWLCSGQSNMSFQLRQSTTGKRDIPQSENPNIRFFDMRANWANTTKELRASVLDSLNNLHYYKNTAWTLCTPKTSGKFSAVAYYFGKMLQDSLQVPIGLIHNAIGGSPAEAWVERGTLEHEFPAIFRNWLSNDFIQDWVRERGMQNISKSHNKIQRHLFDPCYLYETGIMPLQKYPIKGVIWYQGESNAHNKDAHDKLFQLLVQSWRTNWNNAEMPFYYVQLSGMNRPSWPWFRDAQRLLLDKIPHTGMAVSSDKGDSLDVHPRQKEEVGQRLAAWAMNKTYHKTHVVPSGPLYKSVEFKKDAAFVSFDYADGLQPTEGTSELLTFEIAGEDEVFHPAKATIEGNRVKVWSKDVKQPTIVRYGWKPFTRANLVNGAGMPASTFRSDTDCQ